MSPYFITHTEPLHPQKGKEVLFFLRDAENHKTTVVSKEIPHHFYTQVMLHAEAQAALLEVQKLSTLTGITWELKRYNASKSFLRARGSKEDRLRLPAPFLCQSEHTDAQDPLGLNSPSGLLRKLYPPGMIINDPQAIPDPDRIHSRKYISLEEMVADTHAVIDIEVEDWERGQDHIFMAVYLSPHHKILFHDLPFPDQNYNEFQLIPFATPGELGEQLTTIVHQEDPLWIYGHNIMNYDQLQLRNLTQAYFPAANEYYPVVKSAQGLGRVLTKGRWTLDTYAYKFNYENIHANNSLGVLSELKSFLPYDQQSRLVQQSRQGDRPAFLMLLDYCLHDGLASAEAGERYTPRVALKTQHFRTTPDIICTASKLTLTADYWKRRHFLIKGTFSDGWRKFREAEKFSVEKYKREFLPRSHQPGYFRDIHTVYLTPFIAGSMELLQKRSPELLAAVQSSSDPLEKFDLLQTLNAELSYIIGETVKILSWERQTLRAPPTELTRKQEAAFYSLFTYHGLRRFDPLTYIHSVRSALQQMLKALSHHTIINTGTYFYFLQGDLNKSSLEQQGYGCYLGTGPALSLEPGRIVANPFSLSDVDKFIYQGFQVDKGPKTNFEKKVWKEALARIFAGTSFAEIEAYLSREINEFTQGKKPAEEYYLPIKTRTYYRNLLEEVLMSSSVQLQVVANYTSLKYRINERFTTQTQKELRSLLHSCRDDFSYPFLEEAVEMIEHPYPSPMNMVYVADGKGKLLPASMVAVLDLEAYARKIEQSFQKLYAIVQQKQLELYQKT